MSEIVDISAMGASLPAVPPPALDPYLDAAARCLARHGVRRTSVHDVARELGVSRATVYRQVGTMDRLGALLFAREVHRMLQALPAQVAGLSGVDAVVRMAALVCDAARQHPVLRKVLADEPEVAGSYLTLGLPAVIERVRPVVVPLLAAGAAAGELTDADPEVLADWLVRLVTSAVLVAPPVDADRYFEAVLRPVLTPRG
ncbi:MAG TPA: TetR/AcrR family transcriptional regulator [Acidimicrobiales bacterium]|nr:TetR/AcrR family transcriptional regulator [Acidimicrobiales bacterium]